MNLIFKSVTKHKKITDGITLGLNFLEFLECILRIGMKGFKVFNKFADKMKEDGQIKNTDMNEII